MSPTSAYPVLTVILAEGALPEALSDLDRLAAEPGARGLKAGLRAARHLLGALGGGSLPRPVPLGAVPDPPRVCAPLRLPAGLTRLCAELGYLALEMGRAADALALFDLVTALAPGSAAGPVGRAQVLLSAGRSGDALGSARLGHEREPGSALALAALVEALAFAGRRAEARRVLAEADRPMGPVASWLRLMRLGLDEGWLGRCGTAAPPDGGQPCAA